MSKKLFIIAAFSVALLASAEAFADRWNYGVLQFENTSKEIMNIKIEPRNCWDSVTGQPSWDGYPHNVLRTLKILGQEKWELVSVTTSGNETTMYFKQPQ